MFEVSLIKREIDNEVGEVGKGQVRRILVECGKDFGFFSKNNWKMLESYSCNK